MAEGIIVLLQRMTECESGVSQQCALFSNTSGYCVLHICCLSENGSLVKDQAAVPNPVVGCWHTGEFTNQTPMQLLQLTTRTTELDQPRWVFTFDRV